jgi:hypothetical protein
MNVRGPEGTRWTSTCPDTIERILGEFDQPQTISRFVYEVEETMQGVPRRSAWKCQRWRPEVSPNCGSRIQFQSQGATFQREEQRVNLHGVTHLRLTIVPNKNGSDTASLTALRLFA